MPDFNFAPIALQPQQQTSLGDMLGIARGAQAYQQSQIINPLQQQRAAVELEQAKSQLELSKINTTKARALLNPEIMQGIALSEKAGNEATLKRMELAETQAAKIANGQISLINDPLVIKAEKNPQLLTPDDRESLIKLVQKNANLQATNAGINDTKRVEELSRPYLETAINSPEQLRALAISRHIAGLNSAADIKSSLTPTGIAVNTGATGYVANTNPFSGVPVGGNIPGTAYVSKPTPGLTTINGIVGQYDANNVFTPLAIQPNQPNNAQTNFAPSTTSNIQSNKSTNAKQQEIPKILQIDEFKSPGQLNQQEAARYQIGADDFNKIQERATLARESSLDAANIKRNLASASGGKPGQIMRDTGQVLFGDPQKDLLVKNLAQNALRQSALMGVKNQAAEGDVRTANGSEQITAEALAHIVERIESTNLAAEKYNQALIKLQEKHGKDKAYLNNDNFKAAWGNAYDPVAFIIQNTNRQNISQKDKDRIIDYYTRDMSQKQLDDLHNSQVRLKRLERGDF